MPYVISREDSQEITESDLKTLLKWINPADKPPTVSSFLGCWIIEAEQVPTKKQIWALQRCTNFSSRRKIPDLLGPTPKQRRSAEREVEKVEKIRREMGLPPKEDGWLFQAGV